VKLKHWGPWIGPIVMRGGKIGGLVRVRVERNKYYGREKYDNHKDRDRRDIRVREVKMIGYFRNLVKGVVLRCIQNRKSAKSKMSDTEKIDLLAQMMSNVKIRELIGLDKNTKRTQNSMKLKIKKNKVH
jgi:hypothetical protein